MTSHCYLPRSFESTVIGAVFVTAGGDRRFLPDRFLMEAELSEQGRLPRLIYACCTLEVVGQRLDTLFEDALVSRLGSVLQAPPSSAPRDQLWVSCIMAIVPAARFEARQEVASMRIPSEPTAMTVELRHNTSKSSFESNASGNKHRTRSNFVSTFHCRSPSKWKQRGNKADTRSNFPSPDAFGRKSLNARKAFPFDLDSLRR